MKSILLILVLCATIDSANAQEFQKSDAYKVSISPILNDKEQMVFNAILSVDNHSEIVVTNFKMVSPNNLKNITIQTLKQPNLLDVKEIIRMELNFIEPQGYTISKYVLVKTDQTYVDLPAIVNMNDNSLKNKAMYVFPSQVLGQDNKILKLEINYSDTHSAEHYEVLKSFAWHDDFNDTQKITGRL